MKPEELMIGDWVKFDNLKGGSEFIRVGLRTLLNMTDSEYLCSFIEPIPLTPEILEKNGFIIAISYWSNRFGFPFFICKDKDEYDLVVLSWEGEDTCVHSIKYVHQLQHLMRDFEIEKEIEL